MTERNEIYRCEMCEIIVNVEEKGPGGLSCCGKPMTKLIPMDEGSEGLEKHVPVLEITGNEVVVKVGSVMHPMDEDHYIEFVELLQNDLVVAKKQFKPGDEPLAKFVLDNVDNLKAREVCNKHGLWIR